MAYEYECEEVIKNVIKELIYFKKGKNELAEKEIDDVYTKAKAFDELVEYKDDITKVKEISLTHATEEPFNSDMYSVHSLVDNLLDVINEYEERG